MIPDRAFYVNPNNIKSNYFHLSETESRHAFKVLRLCAGDEVFILDGIGSAYVAKIIKMDLLCVKGEILESYSNFGENSITIKIAPAIIKNDKFKILIQKGTELGVNQFHPLLLDRCITKKINYSKIEKVIISASKQCRRSRFPKLERMKTLESFLKGTNGPIIAGVMNSNNNIENLNIRNSKQISIIIGPEGDFSNSEIDIMKYYNVLFCKFGHRRLRSETAAIYSLALLNERFQ